MSVINIVPVILCGGSGARLWPLSRTGLPKQFIGLLGDGTMFQQSVRRLNHLSDHDISIVKTLVVANEEHRFLAIDQLNELKQYSDVTFLLEPVSRNTAPALTLAALDATQNGVDPVLVVTPSDQLIQDESAFKDVLQRGIRLANAGDIVMLGVKPNQPKTGYGYIESCGRSGFFGELGVEKFIEKPNYEAAQRYLLNHNYYWNSGIYVIRASTWLMTLKKFKPDIFFATTRAWASKSLDADFVRFDQSLFSAILPDSIDYSVIEKCPMAGVPIKMLPLDAGWLDLGAWDAVWQASESDDCGNVRIGDTLIAVGTNNTYIHSSSRLVGAVGVSNLVIVETPDAVLVANREASQDVKCIVQQLKDLDRNEKDFHRKVNRPWGWYDNVDQGDCFKVKRISVKPGASLSLQMHNHRAEHWIVVKGIAEITNGDRVILLKENQSTYVPKGQVHRLANPGRETLEIIEVQSGDYLGEDDIIRFEDKYGRQ